MFSKKDLSVSNMSKSDEMTLRFVDNGWHSTRPHGVSKSSTRASIFNYVGMSWITWCFATRLQSNSDFLRGIDHVRSQLIPVSSSWNIQLDTCLKAQKLTLASEKIDALEEDVIFETDIVRFQQFVFWACSLVWTWKWWVLFVSVFCLVDGNQMILSMSKYSNEQWTKTRRFRVFFGDYATQLCADYFISHDIGIPWPPPFTTTLPFLHTVPGPATFAQRLSSHLFSQLFRVAFDGANFHGRNLSFMGVSRAGFFGVKKKKKGIHIHYTKASKAWRFFFGWMAWRNAFRNTFGMNRLTQLKSVFFKPEGLPPPVWLHENILLMMVTWCML